MMAVEIDSTTKAWIRNAADERAADEGYRFDEERGQFVVDWIRDNCYLYEGDCAGEPMVLSDWQLECTMRLFGWVRHSEKWDREVRRFRSASIWVPKKNKKSPTLAAWGLYLLAGDGEQGQKVYLAAKDGQQARDIAGRHAVEMLAQSPILSSECKVNQNLYRITHIPTRSFMQPLSSANSRTQQSKEGLNGSVLIDETHVVDRDFVSRISRAGISRSEPLQIEVSTAGNDPDGYGKERFDYAKSVESGKQYDPNLFTAIYAAPQDLSDVELERDPLKYGKMANPAMGHTVDPEEYLADFNRSRRSISALADFKMYRLNIWQRSSSPFIKESDWDACGCDFSEDDLVGRQCVAGLDLSKTRDMSALVLVFPEADGGVSVLPYFWLPEPYARENSSTAAFLQWEADGYPELTPGDVVDYGFIKSRFRSLAERFKITSLPYDPMYANEITQELEQGELDADGRVIVEGTGVPRVAFKQIITHFANPTATLRRLILNRTLRHNRHPVLAWQAGHVQVTKDVNNNERPVKPGTDDHRKIDGVVAMLMALGEVLRGAAEVEKPSKYERADGFTFI